MYYAIGIVVAIWIACGITNICLLQYTQGKDTSPAWHSLLVPFISGPVLLIGLIAPTITKLLDTDRPPS